MIATKRAYAAAEKTDGWRVLVDRLWPRGVSKRQARLDAWAKEAAPSDRLREWFGHDPKRFAAFRRKYLAELKQNPAAAALRADCRKRKAVTLVYGAKDPLHNQAVVLKAYLSR